MERTICVIAEISGGRKTPVTDEAVAFARQLATLSGLKVRILALQPPGGGAADALAAATGLPVTALVGPALAAYGAEAWLDVLAPVLEAMPAAFVCLPHTATGADYAPALAVRLKAACITAVEGCRQEEAGVVFTRSLCKGKLKMDVAPTADACVLTLLPGVTAAAEPPDKGGATPREAAAPEAFVLKPETPGGKDPAGGGDTPPGQPQVSADVPVTVVPCDCALVRTRPLGRIPAPETDLDLNAAEVVVAAGKGIGREENLALIRRLAAIFPKGAVGASRLVCDAGWLPYPHQVGVTGKTVAPKLYLACGISGTIQHVTGMRGSRCIVAINTDPRAAIFQVAHYGIVEDLTTFIPLLLDFAGASHP
ncbi:MAG: electron transfer flavoprotein subunit alpha/FixB family protein [Syntrophales bacterium]|jgi:electron transfer flavoprotein alpha subunit|nr:electron transfer flavoprotein subunit alpha/FixB family protein [Syntrophales bacterium]MDD4339086.1 electron transfer flavoprotein subunit alpha/FixB family protein [Syntrophales bacterium]HOG08634.1 electron transfer flavoprotein subunit alpha/FixB family protein [Syntrophales bacterium]HOS77562.1 electron transfer flavoprotein subunit alpha/FixB family protein [Syntrophales bacterium]